MAAPRCQDIDCPVRNWQWTEQDTVLPVFGRVPGFNKLATNGSCVSRGLRTIPYTQSARSPPYQTAHSSVTPLLLDRTCHYKARGEQSVDCQSEAERMARNKSTMPWTTSTKAPKMSTIPLVVCHRAESPTGLRMKRLTVRPGPAFCRT